MFKSLTRWTIVCIGHLNRESWEGFRFSEYSTVPIVGVERDEMADYCELCDLKRW